MRKSLQRSLKVGGELLKQMEKFKYLGFAYTSDGRQDEELDIRSRKARAVMRTLQALHHLVVLKRDLSRKIKLSMSKSLFVPILTCDHESWIITERVLSQMQVSKVRCLRK